MVAVPAAISGNGDNGDTLFQNHGAEPASQAVENPESSWPTRSTFAGRNNNGDVWEERRSAFYKSIPKTHWKDGEERKFWRLCVDSSVDDAVKKFLADVAVPSHTPTPGSAVKPRVKAKAKAKSAAKLRLPKETGRGRGRGRVKSKRGKAACRAWKPTMCWWWQLANLGIRVLPANFEIGCKALCGKTCSFKEAGSWKRGGKCTIGSIWKSGVDSILWLCHYINRLTQNMTTCCSKQYQCTTASDLNGSSVFSMNIWQFMYGWHIEFLFQFPILGTPNPFLSKWIVYQFIYLQVN